MKVLKQLVGLLGILVPFALVWALALTFSGEDLGDVEGRPYRVGAADRDLVAEALRQLDAGRPFECSEAELNAHVGRVLRAREGPGFDLVAENQGTWVRLLGGSFELVLERDVLGLNSTVSVRFSVEREDGGHSLEVKSGRFGRLPAPKGAINLLRGGLEHIGAVFEAEKDVLSRAGHLTITPGLLRLEPRAPAT